MPLIEEQYLRGKFPAEIDENKMSALAGALAHAIEGKLWVVGRDARVSGQPLQAALVKGLARAGAEVIDLGLASAPQVAYAVLHFKAGAGALVTGGDSAEDCNGLKVWGRDGAPVGRDSGLAEVGRLLQQGATNLPRQPGAVRKGDIFPEYLANLMKYADDLGPLSIVVDMCNGVMGKFLPDIFEKLPCELIPLSAQTGPVLSGSAEDSFHNLALLGQKVRETGADLGIAFDADGDRCRVVDNLGDVVPPEMIAALLAGEIVARDPQEQVAGELLLGKAMYDEVDRRGGKWTVGPRGHCRFSRFLRESKIHFGCAPEGRYYFREILYLDNPELAVIQLIALISREKKPLSQLTAPLNHYIRLEEETLVVDDADDALEQIAEYFEGQEQKVFRLVGVSVYFFDCWFQMRKHDAQTLIWQGEVIEPDRLNKLRDEIARSLVK